jgi:hypothetical protein
LEQTAALVAAGAALVAAILSGFTLYASGRREERRWRREELIDAYEAFITISFTRTLLAVQTMQAHASGERVPVGELQKKQDELHDKHDGLLTRLRLLGRADVVQAAEALHMSDHSLVDPAMKVRAPISEEEWQRFEENRDRNRQSKDQMFTAARKTIGLHSAVPLGENTWGPRSLPRGFGRQNS